ncbi:MAG TPA: carboxypeptidase-like regulatory domain-containing protein [Bacteroidales bacterium]|nr:carboxypeptidase-like regulatory domain-containing protein [Bacteroidales bacterium]
MKTLIISALISILSLGAHLFAGNPSHPVVPSKSITLTGVVVDSQSGEALAGAQVEVEGAAIKSFTNLDGKFSITVDSQTNLNLKVKYISYEEATLKNIAPSSASSELKIKLDSK